jgi:penicillin-binding protein 1A
MRQPGSTFKLFVYTEAMNQGLTPCDTRRDEFFTMKVVDHGEMKSWTPTNANGRYSGADMPLKSAFAQSVNTIAVKLGQEMGIERIARTAHDMGITSELTPTPALALGASDVTLLELVNSYATVANDGMRHQPILVTKILDREGNEIYKAPTEQRQAIPYRSAFLMQQMLMGGMREPGGTSMSLWGYVSGFPDTDFGGKTGTSNNHSDAWFMGVSPNLVVGAWVGGEYRSIHFRTGALGQGSRTALPICGYFLQSVLSDPAFKKYHGKFAAARDGISASLYNCQGYYQVNDSDSLSLDSLNIEELEYDGEEIPNQEADPAVTDAPQDNANTTVKPQTNTDVLKPEE